MAKNRLEQIEMDGAGGGIRTHERLRDRVLSPTPLTRLGDPCTGFAQCEIGWVALIFICH
jgi:hypothetical protein